MECYLYTDSSTQGWGAKLQDLTASGIWSQDQAQLHINVLELQAIWLGLRAFSQRVENTRVALMSDNTSAVAYLEKSGGHQIARNERFSHGHMSVGREEGNDSSSPLSSRASECVSGPSVPEGSNPQDRVEPKPDCSRQDLSCLGRPFVDLFALGKNTKLAICVSPIREETSWKVDSLVQNWDDLYAYAYPPTSLIRACLNKVRTENVEIVLIAPVWPNQEWFPDLLGSLNRLSNISPTSAETAQADLLTPLSSASVASQPSRLEVIKGFHKERGFSEAVAQRLAISQRQSSAVVYESKWKVFGEWCHVKQIDPVKATVQQLADFLIFLFEEKKLAISSIQGYRSCISKVFLAKGIDISHDRDLNMLVRNFAIKRPVHTGKRQDGIS